MKRSMDVARRGSITETAPSPRAPTEAFEESMNLSVIENELTGNDNGSLHQSVSVLSLPDFQDHHGYGYAVSASSDEDDSSSGGVSSYRRRSVASIADSESAMEAVTGRYDTRIAHKLRLLVITLFVSMGIWFPIVIYITVRSGQVNSFEAAFETQADQLIEGVEFHLVQTLQAVDALRIAITSHASTNNASWPFVTIPDYDLRAQNIRDLANVISVNLHPIVSYEDRLPWEEYAVDNIEWLMTSLERQENGQYYRSLQETRIAERWLTAPNVSDMGVFTGIFNLDADSEFGYSLADYDKDESPYYPSWQSFPPMEEAVNLNLPSFPGAEDALTKLVETEDAVLSQMIHTNSTTKLEMLIEEYTNQMMDDSLNENVDRTGPLLFLLYPVFNAFDSRKQEVVGVISVLLFAEQAFWFTPGDAENEPVVTVVANSCGDEVSYKLEAGGNTEYLGTGDKHDGSFGSQMREYSFQVSSSHRVQLNDEHCHYGMRIYPHDDLHKKYVTNKPVIYALSVTTVIFVISIISLTYDYFVQRRMKRAVKSAKENRAIVSSLFPANVRDRLIHDEEERKQDPTAHRRNSMSSRPSGDASSRRNSNEGTRRLSNEGRRRNSNEATGISEYFPFGSAVAAGLTSIAPPKLMLKFFLNETNNKTTNTPPLPYHVDEIAESMAADTKPIADLFPNCTVFFSDISGFTAWSSEREPEQVFLLLQTIFGKFDSLARKHDIFKVETIGDCYVAVTGLPDPQPDHAVRMTKFARACMHKVSELTKKLEVVLGPGTGDLRMRFGLNSGPVTAGVLRGEKSRFQLFGDTVNTASRMESTGQRNRIQVSQSTAQLLIESGKGNWIQPREDVVHAKGKGAVQTYWVLTRRQTPSSEAPSDHRPKFIESTLTDSNSDLESMGSAGSIWGEEEYLEDNINQPFGISKMMLRGNYDRLIDWQADLLLRILKQIVAGRDNSLPGITDPTGIVTSNCTFYEEVSESIELPKFDPKAARARARPSSVEMSLDVVNELRDYVRTIASRYRDNPFHNFAHASHVSLSASKLVSRIVKPDDVDYHRKSVKAIASDLHQYTFGITSDPLTQFAIAFSTLIHDVDHSGVSNFQRNEEEPELAAKFKNRSVAEQNSIDIAWNLLMSSKYTNLQHALFHTEEDVRRFRQLLVNLVMATDIFEKDGKKARNLRWNKVFHSNIVDALLNPEYRNLKATIVIEHIIQAADVSHTMQHWQVYSRWNERLFQEMYRAFEDGRSTNDPSKGWYKGELGFFDNYVIPLARKLEECGVFGVTSDECLNYALENRREWEAKGEKIVAEMTMRFRMPMNASGRSRTPYGSLDQVTSHDDDNSDFATATVSRNLSRKNSVRSFDATGLVLGVNNGHDAKYPTSIGECSDELDSVDSATRQSSGDEWISASMPGRRSRVSFTEHFVPLEPIEIPEPTEGDDSDYDDESVYSA
eukprot:Nitzschia sp. Nitz4//scaffold52_size167869//51633//56242//NITZ4_002269-RA/size167869-snap-gene-0.210-mRNA-1//1//CDS//3329554014//3167//frame0